MNNLTLKWGTLKSYEFDKTNEQAHALLDEYNEIGSSISCICQDDTPRQKEIICELINLCDGKRIFLDWDDKYVSKKKAKEYVMEYGINE